MSAAERHDLYLTDTVWGELKLRAFSERKTAGAVIAFLLDWAAKNPVKIPSLPRYQARLTLEEIDQRNKRTIRGIPDAIWSEAEQLTRKANPPYSISGLVEHLLRSYLGLYETETEESTQDETRDEKANLGRGLVQTGRVTFNLGDNPVEIDLADENRPELPGQKTE